MDVELRPEARAEFREAATWYEEQRASLVDEFIGEIGATLDRIGHSPTSYPRWPGIKSALPIHKATVRRFPYLIIFELHERLVRVLAISHQRRRSLYWLSRSTSAARRP